MSASHLLGLQGLQQTPASVSSVMISNILKILVLQPRLFKSFSILLIDNNLRVGILFGKIWIENDALYLLFFSDF
jgi:hypothetical protein